MDLTLSQSWGFPKGRADTNCSKGSLRCTLARPWYYLCSTPTKDQSKEWNIQIWGANQTISHGQQCWFESFK